MALEAARNTIERLQERPAIAFTIIVIVLAAIILFPTKKKGSSQRTTSGPAGSSGREWKGWDSETTKENSYYFAHSRANDGLKACDYEMEKPKLLEKTTPAASPARPKALVLEGKKITAYSFCDGAETAEVLVQIEGWNWKEVDPSEVSVEMTTPSSLVVNVVSSAFGSRHLHVPKLFGEVSAAVVTKRTSKRLTLALTKAKTGITWPSLAGKA